MSVVLGIRIKDKHGVSERGTFKAVDHLKTLSKFAKFFRNDPAHNYQKKI